MTDIVVMDVLIAMFAGIVYSAFFYAKNQTSTGDPFDPTKAISTLIVGAGVGVGVQLSGLPITELSIETQLLAYAGIISLVDAGIKAIGNKVLTKTKFFRQLSQAVMAEGTHVYTMTEASLQWLTGDLPFRLQDPVANAVKEAEAAGSYTYAIRAGNNIFLIERAQLVGHKKYLLSWGVFGSNVVWKKISGETLAACRKKGFIPEWGSLT